jgi:DNA modification methylase
MQIVAISSIKPNPSNPRLIKDDKFHKLVQSLKDFPEMASVRPIVVNQDMVILGGNMRFKAMKEAKWKQVPVQVVDWDEAKQREFIIKDNVGFGEWDWDDLANNWDAEELDAWGLDVPVGFTEEPEAEEDDYVMPDEIQTDIVLGDLFEIGEHRLLCGDSTDSDALAKLMNGQKADMLFTDPPYRYKKMGKSTGDFKNAERFKERIKDIIDFNPTNFLNIIPILFNKQINAYIFCNTDLVPDYCNWAKDNGYNFNILTWHKKQILPFASNHHLADTEYLIYISKNAIFNCSLPNVNYGKYFILDNEKSDDHPTIKPLEIILNELKISSNINSFIVDLYLGSGSTMVAAHQLKRKCYGMELDPKYCQVIVDRMLKLDPTLQIKRNGQPYLTEGTLQGQNKDAKPGES